MVFITYKTQHSSKINYPFDHFVWYALLYFTVPEYETSNEIIQ